MNRRRSVLTSLVASAAMVAGITLAAVPAEAATYPGHCSGSTVNSAKTSTYATAGNCRGVQARLDRFVSGAPRYFYGEFDVSSSNTGNAQRRSLVRQPREMERQRQLHRLYQLPGLTQANPSASTTRGPAAVGPLVC